MGPKDPPVAMVCVRQVFCPLAKGMSGTCSLSVTNNVRKIRVSNTAKLLPNLFILTFETELR